MKSFFPASYSTLATDALSALIAEKYKFKNVYTKLLVRGVGDTYLVETSTTKFILRIYRSSHRSLPQIQDEVALLLALETADVSVSYPIADDSGEVVLCIDAIEGLRYAVLFSYADGVSVRSMNEIQLRNLGLEMAAFHNVSVAFLPSGARWTFDLDTTILNPLKLMKPGLAGDPDTYQWLSDKANEIVAKISAIDSSEFSKGPCHFDFLPKNFHFDNDRVTFFDFDFMGYGWLVNDIMSFWQHLVLELYTGRMSRAAAKDAFAIFLAAYRERRSVSDQELSLTPWLSFGFWLFYMGFHTTHDQFYSYTQPAHVKSYIGILRHIESQYWHGEDGSWMF